MLNTKSECVKVVMRCRPLSSDEKHKNCQMITKFPTPREILVFNPGNMNQEPKHFTFDSVYNPDSRQDKIYQETSFPIVESVLEGYNGTIFAYGQTGTGKTFTMEGISDDDNLKGITPRTFDHIFKSIEGCSANRQFLVRASYLELYNEEVRDLLVKSDKKLEVRERTDIGYYTSFNLYRVYVRDLSSFMIQDIKELFQKLSQGRENRHTGETKMNRDSSRSHSIFMITVEMSDLVDGQNRIRAGKLNLVDLAGSERQSKTHAQGDRLKEAININQSLTTLGNVISALVDNKSTHIPYRDSKLTRLLQDSLGGNTKTVMVANIGPADYNYDETISTLRYANRAKNIQNKPKINEDPKDALLRQFQEEIEKLKAQLAGESGGNERDSLNSQIVQVEKIIKVSDHAKAKEIEKALEREKEEIRLKAEAERKKIEELKNIAESEKNKLLYKLAEQEASEKALQDEKSKLLKKYKKMEKRLIRGQAVMEEAEKKERELMKAQREIEENKNFERQIADELKEKELMTIELEKKYNSQKEEVDDKTKSIKLLWNKIKQIEMENKELDEFYQEEIEELQEVDYFIIRREEEFYIQSIN